MADINLTQVIHNIKEKYLLATEDTDEVKYGNIAQKVYDAISSGGKADGSLARPFVEELTITINTEAAL